MNMDLRSIRNAAGKSQNEVASMAGLSQQYYSFIESGERGKKLPVPTAKRIAAALGFDWKLFYEDEKNEKER